MREALLVGDDNSRTKCPMGSGPYSAVPPPPVGDYDAATRTLEQMEADERVEVVDSPNGTLFQTYPSYRVWCEMVGNEWVSRSQRRKLQRQEWDAIQKSLANEPDDEPAPTPTITFPALINGMQDIYTMEVGGLGAAYMVRHGWVPGQGLGLGNDGIRVPVELTMMSETTSDYSRRTTLSQFLSDWAQPGDHPRRYTSLAGGSLREDSYPFEVTGENVRAWDWVMARSGSTAASDNIDNNADSANATIDLLARDLANATINAPVRNSANAITPTVAPGWGNAAALIQANDRANADAARQRVEEREAQGIVARLPVMREIWRQVDSTAGSRGIVRVQQSRTDDTPVNDNSERREDAK